MISTRRLPKSAPPSSSSGTKPSRVAYGTACSSSLKRWLRRSGARPEVTFNGAIDNAISQRIADSLLAVLREALTNAGKHAKATSYIVTISVAEDVSLEVRDNGIGIELPEAFGAGLGLVNLRSRAERLGGSFEILTGEDGTRLLWRVPV